MSFRPALDGAYGLVWCTVSEKMISGEFYYDGDV